MNEVYAYFTPLHVLWFAVGGGFGAALRYSVSQLFLYYRGNWPLATWSINLSGALLLGFAAAYFNDHALSPGFLFWELGVLGGYTTMSTFAVETVTLAHVRYRLTAIIYMLGSAVTGLGALALGFSLGGLLS